MPNSIKRMLPGLTLLLLAPMLGELVSGHQSPLEFINPMNFIILSLPYGFGALICRELVVRWKKGWLSLLLLGVAYGIYEEAIVVYSVFDPDWAELGNLARYGSFAGVNWTWGMLTVHFHALISIGASVVLAELLFPERRHEPWLGKKALIGCFAGLLAWVPVMGLITILYMKRAFPPPGWYGSSWLAVLGLGWAAYRSPASRHRPRGGSIPGASRSIPERGKHRGQPLAPVERTPPHPIFFFILGLVNMFAFFFTVDLTADFGRPPLFITVLLLLVLDGATLWLALRWSGNGYRWDDRHRLALFAGFLGFFIYFSFDQDFEKWQGASVIAVLTILALGLLGGAVARRLRSQEEAGPGLRERPGG